MKGLWAQHRANVFAEFKSFPDHLRRAMGNDPERWWDLRGAFCAAGYEWPAAILKDIKPEGAPLLFGRPVQQGMHKACKIAELEAGAEFARERIERLEVELSKAKKANAPASQIAEFEAKLKAAREELNEWQNAEAKDADLAKLEILERHHGKDVQSWAAYGLVTVPLELVIALQRVGLSWGMQRKGSKDVMHLELPLDLIDRKTGEVKEKKLEPKPGPIVVPPH